MTGVTKQDPLVTVQAYVPLTPIQFESAYPKMDGITVLLTENEILEAELLVSNGEHRNFLQGNRNVPDRLDRPRGRRTRGRC